MSPSKATLAQPSTVPASAPNLAVIHAGTLYILLLTLRRKRRTCYERGLHAWQCFRNMVCVMELKGQCQEKL